MVIFDSIFGNLPPPLGDDCRIDYDRKARPDIAFNRQRTSAWEASERYRRAGDANLAISAALLTLCYDGMGQIVLSASRETWRLAKPTPAYGIFRSLRTRLKVTGQTLDDVKTSFEKEAEALLAYLPPIAPWRTKAQLWNFIKKGLAEVS